MRNDFLAPLYLFDPAMAEAVEERLNSFSIQPPLEAGELLVEETLWGLAQELSLGKTIAEGYTALLEQSDPRLLDTYQALTRKAAQESGPTFAKVMARTLVPVLLKGDSDFLSHFLEVVQIIRSKGIYALMSPLGALCVMLKAGDQTAGKVFLTVLEKAFSQEMTYNQCKQIANLLGQECLKIRDSKKAWILSELNRITMLNVLLVEPFFESLKKELGWLDHQGLSAFVTAAIEKYRRDPVRGEKFISLSSQVALDACLDLQRIVPLSQIRHRLDRYIQAAVGIPLRIRSVSSQPTEKKETSDGFFVFSDGRHLYLPDEIGMGGKEANVNLYKVLARLEAGYYEFHTYSFDIQKWADRHHDKIRGNPEWDRGRIDRMISDGCSDLECFFQLFPMPHLASDLFAVFEHGRIWTMLSRKSPGVGKRAEPFLQQAIQKILKTSSPLEKVLLHLYGAISANQPLPADGADSGMRLANRFSNRYFQKIQENASIDTIADLVFLSYGEAAEFLQKTGTGTDPCVRLPFGRRIRPDLVGKTFSGQQKKVNRIQHIFSKNGLRVYRSEIQRRINPENGKLHPDDIDSLLRDSGETGPQSDEQVQAVLYSLQQEALADPDDFPEPVLLEPGDPYRSFRYPEWDMDQEDYLRDHVRVRERTIPEKPGRFYQETLSSHRGLIKQIRHSFELLKPERLTILRRWIEGDEFDYRSLLDFAIEKKAGITPSERIYTKRIKQVRDVSVLVLVDLSRSTANPVPGTEKSVLFIEKEAIVLLCEALSVVGDSFSIAGFSGTGRLGVDYYLIKDFHEALNESVIQRINAMQPLRSTRLGAAIRHAASRLGKIDSKVRLLLILSDGFPNDNGYKQEYAIQDTRKALLEARSGNLFAHSITVNMSGDSKLDQLYGKLHHNVISDVCELPDQLLKIYGNLTRS